MSAKVLENGFVVVSAEEAKDPGRLWPAVAICGFVGSGVCFALGLIISALVELEVVAASRVTAYVTVAILLSAFGLAFLGAHAMDRIRSAEK